MLLERLQEELLVFGVRVARVVDVVVRGVDPRRRELHPVLKRSTIIRWRRSHCYSNTGRPNKEILHPGERVSRFRSFSRRRKSKQSDGHCPAILFSAQSEISKFPAFCLPAFPGQALNAGSVGNQTLLWDSGSRRSFAWRCVLHLHMLSRHARRKSFLKEDGIANLIIWQIFW